MRVVDAETREPIGAWRSFKREIVLHLAPMPVVELVLILVRSDRRRIGDLWAKTLVVRTKKQ